MTAAFAYLHRDFPVYDESYLPSANMLATLAVFFWRWGGPERAKPRQVSWPHQNGVTFH
jgi:hypothetical protein